jgi:hypothetical protein
MMWNGCLSNVWIAARIVERSDLEDHERHVGPARGEMGSAI